MPNRSWRGSYQVLNKRHIRGEMKRSRVIVLVTVSECIWVCAAVYQLVPGKT